MTFQAEFVVHRIGGPDNYPTKTPYSGPSWERCWGGTGQLDAHTIAEVYGEHNSDAYMLLDFSAMAQIETGWWATTVRLRDGLQGQYVGRAPSPMKIFAEPWDVHVFTTVFDAWYGHFSVGVRALRVPGPIEPVAGAELLGRGEDPGPLLLDS